MSDKRREDVPEIPEGSSETEGNGIDIPVPEEAPMRGRSRRGRKRAESPGADPGLLPESSAPAGTVYTLGPQNEFGDVEDISFESPPEDAAAPSAPKEGAALDISDIPNAVPTPDAPKSAGKSRKRKKRRAAQPRNTAAASEKASVPAADDAAPDSAPAEQEAPAAESAAVPEEPPADTEASENADKAPSGEPETSEAAEPAANVADAAPKAARSTRRGKRRPAQAEQPDSGDAPSETNSARASDGGEAAASRDAVSILEEEPSAPAKKSKKKSRRPAVQTEGAAETPDAPSETPEKPPRVPKPKAPAAELLLHGVLTENPLLLGLAGVFPAVAAASTGITALAAGICVLAALIVTNLAASLIGGRLPRRLRAALLLLLAACVSSGELLALEALLPETADALGIFVPLVAVCGLTLSRESFASEHHPVSALIDAAACGVGFAAALTLFGAIREVIGAGALFGLDISVPGLPPVLVFAAPAGGLLLLGLLSGAARYVGTKRRASKRGSKEAEL